MNDIRAILQQVELHDSTLNTVGDSSVCLLIDFDEVWNKELLK